MTLIITAVRPEGVFQSADQRITTTLGDLVDDAAAKQLSIKCPPLTDGPQVLLAFTGLAEMPDGTPMLRWIRETVRGETRFLMPLLEHLRNRLNRDLGTSRLRRIPLVLAGGVLQQDGRRFYIQIANMDASRQLQPSFRLVVLEMDGWAFFVTGSGGRYVSSKDRELLGRQLQLRPSRWEDHLGLLAAINRRAAAADPGRNVSPWCQSSFACLEREGIQSRGFREHGDPPQKLDVNIVFAGIDFTESMRQLIDAMRGTPTSDAERDQTMRRGLQGRT